MPGQRRGSGSRSRRSWLPVLAGFGAVVVVVGGAAVAYAVMFHSASPAPASQLPTKVASYDTVGLAGFEPGVTPPQLVQLLAPQGTPGFVSVSAAENANGQPQWTADLMQGGTYIFIYLASGQCLSVTGSGTRPALAVQHCEVSQPQQRWRRLKTSYVAAQHNFYVLENVADGKCISQTGAPGQPGSAGLSRCDAAFHPASELLSFWWTIK